MVVSPESTAVQLVPLLVERKTAPPLVPAKRFVAETARAAVIKPFLAEVQVVPLLVDRKTLLSLELVAAKRFVPLTVKALT